MEMEMENEGAFDRKERGVVIIDGTKAEGKYATFLFLFLCF
jgi:hypothetical protein